MSKCYRDLDKYLLLSIQDAIRSLTALGWEESGSGYVVLHQDKNIRYPVQVALEFESERFLNVAAEIRGTVAPQMVFVPQGEVQLSCNSSNPSERSGAQMTSISTRLDEMFSRLTTLEANVSGHEQKIGKLEAWKSSLTEWIKSLLNPPGSREWIDNLRKPK